MSNPADNKSFALRAAAILTTGVVNNTPFAVNRAANSRFNLDISFTLGSLTNVTLLYYVSDAIAGTYVPIESLSGGLLTLVPTGDITKSIAFDCSGWAYFRCSAQGSGTVTSSSLALTARYVDRPT